MPSQRKKTLRSVPRYLDKLLSLYVLDRTVLHYSL